MSSLSASFSLALVGTIACVSAAAAAPPVNDEFGTSQRLNQAGTQLTSVSAPGTNVEATTGQMPNGFGNTTSEPTQCYAPGVLGNFYGNTVWYTVTADVPGRLTVRVDPTAGFDPIVRVIPLAANGLPIASRSTCRNDGGQGDAEVLQAGGSPGVFRIQLGGFRLCLPPSPCSTSEGSFTVSATLERDTDGDGTPDAQDECQTVAGPLEGCPDSDRDGVPDHRDRCPNQDATGRDADRDGCLDVIRLEADALLRFSNIRRGIRVTSLKIRNVPKGAKVEIRCTKGACKKTAFTARRGRAARTVGVRALRGKRLRAGTRVVIAITQPGAIGTYIQYRVRKRGLKKIERCLPVGSTTPRRKC